MFSVVIFSWWQLIWSAKFGKSFYKSHRYLTKLDGIIWLVALLLPPFSKSVCPLFFDRRRLLWPYVVSGQVRFAERHKSSLFHLYSISYLAYFVRWDGNKRGMYLLSKCIFYWFTTTTRATCRSPFYCCGVIDTGTLHRNWCLCIRFAAFMSESV